MQPHDTGTDRHRWTIALVAGIGAASDLGYYFALPLLDQIPNYNDGAIAVAVCYVFWTGIAVITFWRVYAT